MPINKKVDLETMEDVNGGTVSEYPDLLAALSINPKLQKWGRFAAHLPGGGESDRLKRFRRHQGNPQED